ncbi:hypothetical protein Tsubulata_028223 [Turnera subulata]|uniref:Zinc knuckle CX2CX4HX4C domain-containing protein n=1 Tax=Turnera subulata TaxID=218843 RepID=A0A9Q0JM27_9ROSI|nr:hypothetical protein Tsubulata_028223 [Turnera subulata]
MGSLFAEYNGLEEHVWLAWLHSYECEGEIGLPLIPRVLVEDLVGNMVWIRFKYEKFTDFCYRCGRIDHTVQTCKERARVDEGVEKWHPIVLGPR